MRKQVGGWKKPEAAKGKRRAGGRQPSRAPPPAQGCSWPRAPCDSKFWFSSDGWFRHGPCAIATCSRPFLLSAEQEGRAWAGNACRPCFPQRRPAPVRVRWGLVWNGGTQHGYFFLSKPARESVTDREAWRAAVHGVAESRARLSDRTEQKPAPVWTRDSPAPTNRRIEVRGPVGAPVLFVSPPLTFRISRSGLGIHLVCPSCHMPFA